MIEKIVILSLVTVGLCCPFWDDMILEKTGNKIKLLIGEFWSKPLFGCYICATFWYGLLQCYIYGWPLYLCIPAMGFSAVISLLHPND